MGERDPAKEPQMEKRESLGCMNSIFFLFSFFSETNNIDVFYFIQSSHTRAFIKDSLCLNIPFSFLSVSSLYQTK